MSEGPAPVRPGTIVEAMFGNQWHMVQPGTFVETEDVTQFVMRGTGLLVTVSGEVQAVRSEMLHDRDAEPRAGEAERD